VAASDVLYEAPHAALVAAALAATLSPGGLGLLSDPCRRTADALPDECARWGLAARRAQQVPALDAGTELIVSLIEVRRAV
jgi:hypothetical protein